jgi:AraC-like DNA-binding protein/mannose-6-phosphate isomerase-like protein (cupin superfamily)
MNNSVDDLSGFHVLDLDHAGITAGRPFRFRTIHWCSSEEESKPGFRWVCPADRPEDTLEHSVELYVPGFFSGNRTPPHRHLFYEIALVREGSAEHVTDSGREKITRGDAVVVTPSGRHAFESYQDLVVTNIYLQPAWFANDLKPLWAEEGLVQFLLADALFSIPGTRGIILLHTTEEETAEWELEVASIEREARRDHPSLALFNGAFLKVLAVLNRAYRRQAGGGAFPLHRGVWVAAERIEQVIEQSAEFDLARIARDAGMSPDYFSRVFREQTGWPPSDYYQHRRIQHAANLLVGTGYSCTEIAHRLHFADGPHLSRTFKRLTGLSPRAYREKHAARHAEHHREDD